MLLEKPTTWIVVMNTNTCKIYNYKKTNGLTLLKEITHPENKLRDIELTADKPGRYKSDGAKSTHGTFSQPSDPKEIKINDFSREIAKELDHNRNIQSYEKLIIIAAPRMSGFLFQHLNKHVSELITNHFEKDLLHLPDHALLEFLQTHL